MKFPKNIKSMVVMNSWLWDFSDMPVFKKYRKIINSPITPFLYKQLNFSPKYLLPQSFGSNKPSRKILNHYTKAFPNSSQRNGALAFARSLVNDQHWFQSLWQKREVLQHVPMLFVWGMKDKFVQPAFLDRFVNGFLQSSFVKLDDCGHFPQEENPKEVTAAIQAFLRK